jgi:hypothetical protein
MLKSLYARSKRVVVGAALCAAIAMPSLAPKPAQAWWGPGWHGGFVVGLPPVVVGPPVPAPVAYPYPYPYAYPPPYWHWVPAYHNAAGILVEGHWEHR